MAQRNFFYIMSILFFIIGLLHLVRLIRGWEAAIGGWPVPMWLSIVALVVAWLLTGWGIRLAKK